MKENCLSYNYSLNQFIHRQFKLGCLLILLTCIKIEISECYVPCFLVQILVGAFEAFHSCEIKSSVLKSVMKLPLI